jgi:hypothetical protein
MVLFITIAWVFWLHSSPRPPIIISLSRKTIILLVTKLGSEFLAVSYLFGINLASG